MIDEQILAYAVKYNDLNVLLRSGVSNDHFVDEYRTAWRFLQRMKRQHDTLPSPDTFRERFPDISLPRVRRSELPMLVDNLNRRRKFIEFLTHLNNMAGSGIDYENVNDKIQILQGQLNTLAYQGDGSSHLVDLFSPETAERMIKELRLRKRGKGTGIPTGFKRFDRENGGLEAQKMAVIMGRTGIGKTWVDLAFVARAIMNGDNTILYPLEMTLFEVAFRLYSIFSHEMFGGSRTIRNLDLQRGNINVHKCMRLFNLLQDKFGGSLLVADVGSLQEDYTIERIEAEAEAYKPKMIWVDYITLVKPTPGTKDEQGYRVVQQLSGGLAKIAKRRNLVAGCSAQVNREALKSREFLPRLEHISFGDSIGQDADYVFSINRKGDDLYYALVKCRGGVEIPRTRVRFKPNDGIIKEHRNQDEDGD